MLCFDDFECISIKLSLYCNYPLYVIDGAYSATHTINTKIQNEKYHIPEVFNYSNASS